MIPANPAEAVLVAELLAVLDEEIALLNGSRAQLEMLCTATIERDDRRLGELLVEMEKTHLAQRAADLKLDALRRTLADRLDCPLNEMKLSRLIERLPDPDRLKVDCRRQQIVVLAEELRRRHMAAAVLLRESSRVNRMLLEGLFPRARPVTTYSASGPKSWQPDAGLLDSEI